MSNAYIIDALTYSGMDAIGKQLFDEDDGEVLPINDYYTPLSHHKIYKNSAKTMWIELVLVQDGNGEKKIKLYKWIKKEDPNTKIPAWKVDLANFEVGYWHWTELGEWVSDVHEQFEF